MNIETALDTVDLSKTHRPRHGNCREIGVALHDMFGSQLLAVSQVPNWKQLDTLYSVMMVTTTTGLDVSISVQSFTSMFLTRKPS